MRLSKVEVVVRFVAACSLIMVGMFDGVIRVFASRRYASRLGGNGWMWRESICAMRCGIMGCLRYDCGAIGLFSACQLGRQRGSGSCTRLGGCGGIVRGILCGNYVW